MRPSSSSSSTPDPSAPPVSTRSCAKRAVRTKPSPGAPHRRFAADREASPRRDLRPASVSAIVARVAMDGILLIDKPGGITSAEVVRRIKARVRPSRVGHLGTLDPFATGLLPILVGEGTKLAPFLQDGEKQYEGTIALGVETDTLDPTGLAVRTADVPAITPAMLAETAARFTGRIVQQPPIFSAIKRGGVPLYKLARRGDEVEPP